MAEAAKGESVAKRAGKTEGQRRPKAGPGRRPRASAGEPGPRLDFSSRNYALLGVGCAVIALGFVLLGRGSITLAPVLLILGYCVLIPVAIMLR